MPVKLISEQERHSLKIGDTTIYYRRVPSFIQQKFEAEHTQRGLVDRQAVVEAVLAYAVLGWDGVQDMNGQPVPYSAELLKYFPEEARVAIVERLYQANPLEASLKKLRQWLEGRAALKGFDCHQCRAQSAETDAEVPCDATGRCPYTPSPGDEAALASENWLAVFIWERWKILGTEVWQLLNLELSPSEAGLLLEQIYFLETYSAYLERLQQGG